MLTIIKQNTLYVVMPSLILKKNLKAFKFQASTNIRDLNTEIFYSPGSMSSCQHSQFYLNPY